MPKFRKKPVVVEAVNWDGSVYALQDIEAMGCHPETESIGTGLLISTPEGIMRANAGDWVIKGVKGEFYPCKPDVFAETYEEAI